MTDDVEVKFGGNAGELASSIVDAAKKIQTSIAGMQQQFEGLTGKLSIVQSRFIALGAIIAGGALFKHAVEDVTQLTRETEKLAEKLGITTEEASALTVALDDIGSSTEVYSSAATHLTRSLRSNEDGLNKLGLVTRDANGNARNQNELLRDALKLMSDYKAGTDRNIAAQQFFGRGSSEVARLQRLNNEVMEESRIKASRLGLTITGETVTAHENFRRAVNDVDDVMQGFKRTIVDAVLPALTKLGQILGGEVGIRAVEALRTTFLGLEIVMHAVAAVFTDIYTVITGFITISLMGLFSLGKAMKDFFNSSDPSRWKADMAEALAMINEQFNTTLKAIEKNQAAFKEYLDTAGQAPPSKKTSDDGKIVPLPSRVPQWTKMWEDIQASQKNALTNLAQMESDFWNGVIRKEHVSSEERKEIARKMYGIRKSLQNEELQSSLLAVEKAEMSERDSIRRRIDLAYGKYELMVAAYGKESLEARRANLEIEQAIAARLTRERELAQQRLDIGLEHKQRMLAIENDTNKSMENLGVITTQTRIQLDIATEQEGYAAKLAVLQEHLSELFATEVDARQKTNAEIERLNDEHTAKLTAKRLETLEANKRDWESILSPIQSAISTSVQGMILGTTTLRKSMQNLGISILGEFVSLLAKMLVKWVATQLAMTGATASGVASRLALESWAAIKSVALTSWAAIKKIAIYAWEAAAAVYQAIAAIPFVGPFLAPALAVAAGITVLGYAKNIASAEGGWEVPHDTLAMVHKDEKILPPDKSRAMDELLKTGGSTGGGDHFTIQALDSADVARFMRRNAPAVAKGLREHVRNFGTTNVKVS